MINHLKTVDAKSALIAFILALPMMLFVPALIFDIAGIEEILKASFMTVDGENLSTAGYAILGIALLALPVALVVSVAPMFRKDAKGKRHIAIVNIILALLIIALMTPTWGGIAKDVWRCDVLRIPNCD